MDITSETPLLGGLSPQAFMRRHWQKKPLLVRQAFAGAAPPLARAALFDLAGRDGVESRLVEQRAAGWRLRHGPFARSQLPPVKRAGWTLLVQGVDLHDDAAAALLQRFRFAPDARLDDLMVSWASDGGGVGPHVDSYDVFLLQVQGRRRWRIGPPAPRGRAPALVPDVPLKILADFRPTQEWLLEPGDMLYVPPGWAHDGVAEGECMTCSIGYRAPGRGELGRELLQRLADVDIDPPDPIYRDPAQPATDAPGRVPDTLRDFAQAAVARLAGDPDALARALGEWLSEPKANVWFDDAHMAPSADQGGVQLDRRTRMLYDERHVYINGESFRAGGRDARLMRQLADWRTLSAADVARLGDDARELLEDWLGAGWLRSVD